MCIGHVGDKDGETAISISALAKKLRVTTPAVSRTMRSLEKKDLIYRETDSKDRRNTFVRLTDTGKKILKQSELEMNDLVEAALLNMMWSVCWIIWMNFRPECKRNLKKGKKERNLYE